MAKTRIEGPSIRHFDVAQWLLRMSGIGYFIDIGMRAGPDEVFPFPARRGKEASAGPARVIPAVTWGAIVT